MDGKFLGWGTYAVKYPGGGEERRGPMPRPQKQHVVCGLM